MKFNILIDQRVVVENFPDLDLKDAVILNFIKDFSHSSYAQTKLYKGKVYYWVSYALVIKNLPLLKIKTHDAIYRRFLKLAKANIIKFHPNNQKNKQTFFCFGNNYDLCIGMNKGISADGKSDTVRMESRTSADGKSDIVRMESRTQYGSKVGRSTDEKSEYYTISNNNYNNTTINNTKSKNKKSGGGISKEDISDFEKLEAEKNAAPPVAAAPPKNDPRLVTVEKDNTAREILAHLNEITTSNYRPTRNSLVDILARLGEGFTKEDCQRVIEVKAHQWMKTNREQWLRPATLFGEKFEGYLNLAEKAAINPKILTTNKSNRHEPIISKEAISNVVENFDFENMYGA